MKSFLFTSESKNLVLSHPEQSVDCASKTHKPQSCLDQSRLDLKVFKTESILELSVIKRSLLENLELK